MAEAEVKKQVRRQRKPEDETPVNAQTEVKTNPKSETKGTVTKLANGLVIVSR